MPDLDHRTAMQRAYTSINKPQSKRAIVSDAIVLARTHAHINTQRRKGGGEISVRDRCQRDRLGPQQERRGACNGNGAGEVEFLETLNP